MGEIADAMKEYNGPAVYAYDKSIEPKANPKVREILQVLLTAEFQAQRQYEAHYRLLKLWGYDRLAKDIDERWDDEEKHAKELEKRMLALGFYPKYDLAFKVGVANDVEGMLSEDLAGELKAIKDQNEAIVKLREFKDDTSRRVVEHLLKDEEDHATEIRAELEQIAQMGIQNYLSSIK